MEYFMEPKVKEITDASFISRIESLLSEYDSNKSKTANEMKACEESLSQGFIKEIDKTWREKLNIYSGILETPAKNLDELIENSAPSNALTDFQREYLSKIIKIWAIYEVKSKNNLSDRFNNENLPSDYSLNRDIEIIKKGKEEALAFAKNIKNESLEDLNRLINGYSNQLSNLHPDFKALKIKDEALDEKLYAELSSFCLKETKFIEYFSANVTSCTISREEGEGMIPINSNTKVSYHYPSTLLTLDHPVIKKLLISDHSIPLAKGSFVTFDVDMTILLKELVPNITEINKQYYSISSFFGGYGSLMSSSRFEQLKIKRNAKYSESVASEIKLPGEIVYKK